MRAFFESIFFSHSWFLTWYVLNYVSAKKKEKRSTSCALSLCFLKALWCFTGTDIRSAWHSFKVALWFSGTWQKWSCSWKQSEAIIIDMNFVFPSGLWCECSAGPHSRSKEHLHRDALLDGSGGHCLWWKPRCYLRLQGKELELLYYCVSGAMLQCSTCSLLKV